MGFGSYDESEQENQTVEADDDGEAVNVHEDDHEGEMRFEMGASTDELLEQLGDDEDEDEEDEAEE